jgi:hypothetical protein
MVWIMALSLIFIVGVSWYISLPIVVGLGRVANSTVTLQAARNPIQAIEYAGYIWGPLFIVVILVWAIINSQRIDPESVVYA